MHALFLICAVAGALVWVAGWLPAAGAVPTTEAAPGGSLGPGTLARPGLLRRLIALSLLGFGSVGLALLLAGRAPDDARASRATRRAP